MTMHKLLSIALILVSVGATGCTVVKVQPIGADHHISHICIQNNPRVTVGDFVPVMQEGFNNHGVTSQVVSGSGGPGCDYTATYNARRSWDFSTYLSVAQIAIQRDGRQIANANYHLRNKGGLSLTKWASVRSKILPVIDELFAKMKPAGVVSASSAGAEKETSAAVANADAPANSALAVKLAHLKDAHDAGLITKEEHEAKRKELIDRM